MAIDPLTAGLVSGGVKLVGGGISALLGRKASQKEQQAYDEYIKELQNMGIPNPEDYVAQYGFVDPTQLREYLPQLEQAIAMQDTELKNINVDPRYKEAQLRALQNMQEREVSGALPEELAARNQIIRAIGAQSKSAQENVLQNLAQRGMLGGGSELAARMQGIQNAYENQAQQGENLAAQMSQNRFLAGQQAGAMGGGLREQEFGEQAKVGSAQDIINQFNVRNRQDVQQRNIGSQNVYGSQYSDLLNKAYLANVDLRNKQAEQLSQGKLGALDAANAQAKAVSAAKLTKAAKNKEAASNLAGGIAKGASGAADTFSSLFKPKQAAQTSNIVKGASGAVNTTGGPNEDEEDSWLKA